MVAGRRMKLQAMHALPLEADLGGYSLRRSVVDVGEQPLDRGFIKGKSAQSPQGSGRDPAAPHLTDALPC